MTKKEKPVRVETEEKKGSDWIPGLRPPEEALMANPAPGKPGHRCIDNQGKYNPEWRSVFIHKTPEIPERQYFLGPKFESYHVKTNTWVDVPPCIVGTLTNTFESLTDAESIAAAQLMVGNGQVNKEGNPRWQYSVRESA